MNDMKTEDTSSRTDAADAELVRALMELFLAEAAVNGAYCLIDSGHAEAMRNESIRREEARLDAIHERLKEMIEARDPVGKGREGGVSVGLLGVHLLISIVPGILKGRPDLREDPGLLPEFWMDALEVANSALGGLIPRVPEPEED